MQTSSLYYAICPAMRETPTSSHSLLLHLSRRFSTQTVNYCFECEIYLRIYQMIDRTRFRHPPVLFPFRKTFARFRSFPSLPTLPACQPVCPWPRCLPSIANDCMWESVSCYLSFSLRLFEEIVVIRRNWSRINGKERSIGLFLSISRTLANYEHYFSASLCVLFVFFSF